MKEFGYNAVIYLAALTGISPNLYEAAAIDGASRWQSIKSITIPSLIPTVVLLATLAMGNVLNAGFDQVFNMYSAVTYSTGDIIDTYVYRIGIPTCSIFGNCRGPVQVCGQLYADYCFLCAGL